MQTELEALKVMVAETIAEEDKAAKVIASFKAALDAARNGADPSADLTALSASLGEHLATLQGAEAAAGDPGATTSATEQQPAATTSVTSAGV